MERQRRIHRSGDGWGATTPKSTIAGLQCRHSWAGNPDSFATSGPYSGWVTSPPTSRRLVFREYVPHDVEALAPVFADAYAAQFYPQHSDPNRLVSWIEWSRRNYRKHGFGLWALELRSDGTFAGDAGLTLNTVAGLTSLVADIAARGNPRGNQERNREANREDRTVEKNATPARFRRQEG